MKVSLFLIFAVVAATSAHKCMPVSQFCGGAHKEYSACNANPNCQSNCENPGPRPCTRNCVPGCVCKEGYVEDADKNCIKLEECPAIAPICRASEHKYYSQCNAHCPIKTCENPSGEQICNRMCVEGCICEDGYLQDKDGKCITPEECPIITPDVTICPASEHKKYTDCDAYPRNQKTCENPQGPFAIADICLSGCICEDGYVQDKDGNCVTLEECPTTIPDATVCPASEHKTYSQCSAHCPIKTCENPSGPEICPYSCVEGCICEDGYLQDKDGNCITPEECPAIIPDTTVCPASEHKKYTDCDAYPRNQKTCDNPQGPFAIADICLSGCICEDGYVQDKDGNCITPEECPTTVPDATVCPASEHKTYTECNFQCPKTCDNPSPMICPASCVSGCICEDGYLQDKDGNCITQEECSSQKVVPAICLLPQVTGPCRAYIPSWGYNSNTGTCTEFIYGGCQGNENKYDSEAACNTACL